MRVVLVTSGYPPRVGGVERLAADLVERGSTRGIEFRVVVSDAEPGASPPADEDAAAVHRLAGLHALRSRDPDAILRQRCLLREIARRHAPHVVHLFGVSASAMLVLDSLDRTAPLLVSSHGLGPRGAPTSLVRMCVDRAAWITACSAATLSAIRCLAPSATAKSSVVYNGVRDPGGAVEAVRRGPPSILCAGRLAPEKGFDLAIAALARVVARHRDLTLGIAGEGPERPRLERLLLELGITDRVTFLGVLSRADLRRRFAEASVVLVPSRTEGFGLVALEAALAGRPVIASDVEGLPEVVEDGVTGLVVPADDVGALAGAVERLLDDPARRAELGAAARARALERFSLSRFVDDFVALYHRVATTGLDRHQADG